jgi:predicted MFS family arabinose efflux permease
MPRDSILRNRSLLALFTAETISGTGSYMTYLALPWFVLVTTGSAARMGFVLAAELLPVALLGIPSGTLVSKLGARQAMLWSDALRAPLMAAVPLLYHFGGLSFPALLAVVAALGALTAPYFSSQRLILPELLGEDEGLVAQANSVVEGAQRLTSFIGPALAGVLIGFIGSADVLYVDAATFAASFLLVRLFVPRGRPAPEEEEAKGMLSGLRFVLRDPLLGPAMVTVTLGNMLWQVLFAALRVLGFERFSSAGITGAFFAAFGAGAALGSVIAFRIVRRFDALKLSAIMIIVEVLPLWALPARLPGPAIGAALFLSGVGIPIVNAPLLGILTMRTPVHLRAKVMTSVSTFATIAGPLGLIGAGPVLEAIGARSVFFIVASGLSFTSLFFAAVALRASRAGSEVVPAEG